MCKFALQWIVSLGLFLSLLPGTLAALDKTVSDKFIVEPPTLISLGFEWHIDGDDNRNAEVSVQYRKKGEQAWREGLPLLRLQREQTYSGAFHYTAPNMYAGSIFDLEAGAEYECRLVLADPDGIEGVGSEEAGCAGPALLFIEVRKTFPEGDGFFGLVTGAGHVDDADVVGFGFLRTAVRKFASHLGHHPVSQGASLLPCRVAF